VGDQLIKKNSAGVILWVRVTFSVEVAVELPSGSRKTANLDNQFNNGSSYF